MAIARVKVWVANEVLTASDLNSEFNNVLDSALALISPLTGTLNFNGNQATNLRFENQSATQSAAAEGVVYWHSTEDALHISSGTVQMRVPALAAIQHGELVGIISPSGSGNNGATTYSRIQLGTGLSISGTVLSASSVTQASGSWAIRGLSGNVTATTISVDAHSVVLRNNNGETVVHHDAGGLLLDSGASGLNGRDQAGAFSASQTLHAYYISNVTTIATVLADSAPPTGPDLTTLAGFSGYTYWAYIAPVPWNASSNFYLATLAGGWVHYQGGRRVLSAGTGTTETSVDCSAFVPVQAVNMQLATELRIDTIGGQSATHDDLFNLRTVSGATGYLHRIGGFNNGAGLAAIGGSAVILPATQTAYYLWEDKLGVTETRLATVYVQAYTTPNGDN